MLYDKAKTYNIGYLQTVPNTIILLPSMVVQHPCLHYITDTWILQDNKLSQVFFRTLLDLNK